jgi:regulator of sigma E protease
MSALSGAIMETWNITASTLKALWQMITGVRSPDELGGIFRIGAYAGEFAQAGIISLITFTALLSVNLGLINLFPIPMLDGGHLAMYGIEAVKGKPLSERTQEYAFRVGFTAVVFFMLFATWNDLVQLRVIDYLKGMVS